MMVCAFGRRSCVWDRVVLICLALWALIFGLLNVSNIRIEWMTTIMGFAALVLGIVCVVRAIRG